MKKIYYNGKIYTGNQENQMLATAFIIEDGYFSAVGDDATILGLAKIDEINKSAVSSKQADAVSVELQFASELTSGPAQPAPEISTVPSQPATAPIYINLAGKFVAPGFNDSHMHLLSYGQLLNSVALANHTESLADMLGAMRAFLMEKKPAEDQWLMGRGWNHDYFTDVQRMPNRDDLDRISTEIPICVVRCCGHCLVVNSKALEIIGATESTKAPEGGNIGQENGRLDGRFFDNAMRIVYEKIPVPDKKVIKNYIRTASHALNAYGVTSCQTDDYCVFRQVPWQIVNEAFQELEAEGELTVRVYEQSNFETLAELQEFVEAGNVTGTGTNMFKIGPLKMLGDGSLGARTAYLTEPYSDDPTTTGLPVFSRETFMKMISYAHAHNMQVAIHAIGDKCLDDVLYAIEYALNAGIADSELHEVSSVGANPAIEKAFDSNLTSKNNVRFLPRDHRHGIVHCQITRPDQLQKIADLNLHVYAQSIFLDYDIHIVEERVGKERSATSYNWKTLMKKGVSVSNGTDCPVEMPDALAGIQCAVTRKTLRDSLGPYLPDQAFTVKEALDSYTIRGAEASFEENYKGLIKPGYIADFVILEQDPFEVSSENIKDIKVCETYLAGKQVY